MTGLVSIPVDSQHNINNQKQLKKRVAPTTHQSHIHMLCLQLIGTRLPYIIRDELTMIARLLARHVHITGHQPACYLDYT